MKIGDLVKFDNSCIGFITDLNLYNSTVVLKNEDVIEYIKKPNWDDGSLVWEAYKKNEKVLEITILDMNGRVHYIDASDVEVIGEGR